jgi:hypothetical protein
MIRLTLHILTAVGKFYLGQPKTLAGLLAVFWESLSTKLEDALTSKALHTPLILLA